ncbi:hypothetical protein L596_025798 [Steinernema carpocapsae]|uniref:Protein kinase domain-containing protein n=1 Tax=Steinernema carpocapsae TaxID=34508 RepID=A0A4U5M8V9_STECR|nr:hypothetical protein L596_025798 [Steinernema carpocapsae]
MGTSDFTQRGHVLLGLLNGLIEFRFDVMHGERVGVDGKKLMTITSPQSSVAPKLFYVCNAADKICDLRGAIVGNIDLRSATVLGDVLITGDSFINITSGKEVVVDTELKYVPGNIFDPANGQAYDTSLDENGQLIGVLRGKKIYVQQCSDNRTAIHSIKYECVDDDCETLFLDSPVFNCFMIDGCEIAFGPRAIFSSVAVIPTKPVTRDEMFATTTEKLTTAQQPTTDGAAQPSKTESTANSAASTTSEPETTTPMTDEEHSAVYRRLRYGEHHSIDNDTELLEVICAILIAVCVVLTTIAVRLQIRNKKKKIPVPKLTEDMVEFPTITDKHFPLILDRAELEEDDLIDDQWHVLDRIGCGGYSNVYLVNLYAGTNPYAMRVVADDGYNRMAIEIGALLKLEKMNASHFLRVFDSGFAYCPRSERFFSFMVTPMCGPNDLRRSRKGNKFSLACSINIGIQVIEALRQLHDAGFIHCDVKGSNLVPGLGTDARKIYLIDLDTSFPYCDDQKRIVLPRERSEHHAALHYAPLHQHICREHSRKDDLEGWLYSQVQWTVGKLPWEFTFSAVDIALLKQRARSEWYRPEFLAKPCPGEYAEILTYIDSIRYWEEPKYDWILEKLRDVQRHHRIHPFAYDWIKSPVKHAAVFAASHGAPKNPHDPRTTSSAAASVIPATDAKKVANEKK